MRRGCNPNGRYREPCVAQANVKALDEGVLDRLARGDELLNEI